MFWSDDGAFTWSSNGAGPVKLATKAALVFVTSIAIGLVCPGIVAYMSGVFSKEDIKTIMRTNPKLQEKAKELDLFEQKNALLQQSTKSIDETVFSLVLKYSPTNTKDAESAISLRKTIKEHYNEQPPPIKISPFYFGGTMLLWPAVLTFLGWLAVIFPPSPTSSTKELLHTSNVMYLSVLIFLFYRWPTWLRNTQIGHEGRVYFADTHIDISRFGFITQEALAFCVATLLSIIWIQWLAYQTDLQKHLEQRQSEDPVHRALNPETTERVAKIFVHWQTASAMLVLGFVWYAIFFWEAVMKDGDIRYLPSVIIVYTLWISTTILVSLPLLSVTFDWHRLRNQALSQLTRTDSPAQFDKARASDLLTKLEPIGAWNFTASAFAVSGALISPIVNSMIK